MNQTRIPSGYITHTESKLEIIAILRKRWDMIDQIGVLLKSATGEIGTPKAIWKLLYTAIGYVSSFFSFAVLVKDIMGFDKLDLWIKENWGMVIIAGLLVSCLHNRKRVDCCKKVSNSDMQIAISVRDIFWNRCANSYIIPTNTLFRTIMDNEYISKGSVQGRFQLRYFKKCAYRLNAAGHKMQRRLLLGARRSDRRFFGD